MKLSTLLAAKNAMTYAYTLKLKSGARALTLRKVLVALEEEMRAFEEVKNEYIKATGKNELGKDDPEFAEVVARINEAASVEVETKIEPVIEMADLEGVEASAQDIDGLLAIGLIRLTE